MSAILLSLLGIGKGILSFVLGLLKALMDWAGKHPLLAAAIAVDIVLLAGCLWGLHEHHVVAERDATIAQQKQTIKSDESFISTLQLRIKQYSDALTQARKELQDTIAENNKAVDRLKHAADAQLAEAQKQAQKVARERDYYEQLVGKYQHAGKNCGTAEARIACEQALNSQFIKDYQKR